MRDMKITAHITDQARLDLISRCGSPSAGSNPPMSAVEEQFGRMAFNLVARNQDDHVKSIAFLMNQQGEWSLAPAFDVTCISNPSGTWTATPPMTLNGKRNGFTDADLDACA